MNRRVYPALVLIITLVLLLTACGGGAATEPTSTPPPPPTDTSAPSPTDAPTDTPAPTITPVPTDTPEPTATATPDAAATQAAISTHVAERAQATMQADLARIDESLPPGNLGWVQADSQVLELTQYNEELYEPFAPDLVAGDFVLKTDITWESTGGLVTCGFAYRAEPNFDQGRQYLFQMLRLSGLPAWVISLLRYGMWEKDISQVRTAGAIDQSQGATNEVILFAEGGEFTLYINDSRIGSFYDYAETRSDGFFAFFAWQESGESTCQFDNTWIWLIEEED